MTGPGLPSARIPSISASAAPGAPRRARRAPTVAADTEALLPAAAGDSLAGRSRAMGGSQRRRQATQLLGGIGLANGPATRRRHTAPLADPAAAAPPSWRGVATHLSRCHGRLQASFPLSNGKARRSEEHTSE